MHRYITVVLILCCFFVAGVSLAAAQAPADTSAAPAAATAPVVTPATAAPVSPPVAPAEVKPPVVLYEKAKLVVDGKTEANGSARFVFVPEGGKAVAFSIDVLKGTDKKDVAKAIYTQLTIAAGEKYKVKVSGGEIKIERAKKEYPMFSVTIEEVKLPGVSVLVKKG